MNISISIRKDDEVKLDKNTNENKDIVEYGSDFSNCNFISDKKF